MYKRQDQALKRVQCVDLFLVSGTVDDLAIRNRRRIVRTEVIQHMQRLSCALDGIGQRTKAAQQQHGGQEPDE